LVRQNLWPDSDGTNTRASFRRTELEWDTSSGEGYFANRSERGCELSWPADLIRQVLTRRLFRYTAPANKYANPNSSGKSENSLAETVGKKKYDNGKFFKDKTRNHHRHGGAEVFMTRTVRHSPPQSDVRNRKEIHLQIINAALTENFLANAHRWRVCSSSNVRVMPAPLWFSSRRPDRRILSVVAI